MSSTKFRRIYVNAYLDAKAAGQNIGDFLVQMPQGVEGNIKGLELQNFQFFNTPQFPNVPDYESTVDLTYDGVTATYFIDPTLIQVGASNPSGLPGTSLIDELNTEFKATFGGAYDPWSFSATLARIIFTAEPGKAFTFNAGTTIARRIGLDTAQTGVPQPAGSSLVMGSPPIVSRTSVIYLAWDVTTDSINSQNDLQDIFAQIPVVNPSYGAINSQDMKLRSDFDSPRPFRYFRIRMQDDNFQIIQFNENTTLNFNLDVDQDEGDQIRKARMNLPQV